MFAYIKDVNENGIALIGLLANILDRKFTVYLDDSMKFLGKSFSKY